MEVRRRGRQRGLELLHPADVVEVHRDDLRGHDRWQVLGRVDVHAAAVTGDQLVAVAQHLDDGAVEQDAAPLDRAHAGSPSGRGRTDVLDVAVEVERPVAALAPDPAATAATERRGQVADEEAVDPDGSGPQPRGDALGPLRVAADERGGQPVVGAVGERDTVVLAAVRLVRQHGTEDLLAQDLAAGRGVGEDGRAEVQPTELVVRAAAEQHCRAVGHGSLDETGHSLQVPARDQRADVGGLVPRVALPQRAGLREEPREEVVGDRVGHEQPYGGQAHLPGVVELLDGQVDGEVEVGVVEDQQRRLPAELERHRRDVGRRGRADRARRRHRAGEADAPHPRVGHQRRAGLGAEALHDVEHARRQTCGRGDVGEQRRRERRPLRRLGDDGVAGGQRGGDAPRREHQRGVPRRDDRGDAGGVPGDVVRVAAGLDVLVPEREQVVGEEPEVRGHPRDHAAPVRAQQRAVVARLDDGQVLEPVGDPVGDRVQDRGALLGWGGRPRRGRRRSPRRRRPRPRRRRRGTPGRARSRRSARCRRTSLADATRSPPIQCRVSTATPSTTAWCASPIVSSSQSRSAPNDRDRPGRPSSRAMDTVSSDRALKTRQPRPRAPYPPSAAP